MLINNFPKQLYCLLADQQISKFIGTGSQSQSQQTFQVGIMKKLPNGHWITRRCSLTSSMHCRSWHSCSIPKCWRWKTLIMHRQIRFCFNAYQSLLLTSYISSVFESNLLSLLSCNFKPHNVFTILDAWRMLTKTNSTTKSFCCATSDSFTWITFTSNTMVCCLGFFCWAVARCSKDNSFSQRFTSLCCSTWNIFSSTWRRFISFTCWDIIASEASPGSSRALLN